MSFGRTKRKINLILNKFLKRPKKLRKIEDKIETKTKAPSEYNNLKKILQQQKLNEIPAKKPL